MNNTIATVDANNIEHITAEDPPRDYALSSKYKSFLTKPATNKHPKIDEMINLELFLENDKKNTINESWSKLDNTIKMKKLVTYANEYAVLNNLTKIEEDDLINFFRFSIDRKKLYRVKDVEYDKILGVIKHIPALVFNRQSNHFTLKNIDKRVLTSNGLGHNKYNI